MVLKRKAGFQSGPEKKIKILLLIGSQKIYFYFHHVWKSGVELYFNWVLKRIYILAFILFLLIKFKRGNKIFSSVLIISYKEIYHPTFYFWLIQNR